MNDEALHAGSAGAARPRSARALDAMLLGAVLAAILLALAGVVRDPAARPAGAVAVVNGRAIARADLDAMLERLAVQLGHAPGAAERAEVLSRLIDEELLIQRGLALDLPRGDARLRGQLVQEVMSQALQGKAAEPVDAQELAAFYAANEAYFAGAPQLRAARFDFASPDEARAFRAALEAPAGREALLAQHQRERNTFVPDALLGASRLGDYLGADTAARVAALAPGESLLQQSASGGASVLLVLETQAAAPGTLESRRALVETEFRRRRDEQAVDDYLRQLRSDARILIGSGE